MLAIVGTVALGALAGAACWGLVHLAARRAVPRVWAVGLGAAAGIYLAPALAAAPGRPFLVQLLGLLGFVVLGAAGMAKPGLLSLAWLAHAAWDAAGHLGWFHPGLPKWYGLACLGFDLALAGLLLKR